jgi:hypothetical protein
MTTRQPSAKRHLRERDPIAYLTWLLHSYYRHQRTDLELLGDIDADWAADEYKRYNHRIQKIRLELHLLRQQRPKGDT